MADFDALRAVRPDPLPPSEEVVSRARESLMSTITSSTEQMPTTIADERRRRPRLLLGTAAGVAAVLGLAVGVGALRDHSSTPRHDDVVLSATDSPAQAFRDASVKAAAYHSATGSGPIRYVQFENLSDTGHPTYDQYVRPNGSGRVGEVGKALEETSGFLPSAEVTALPSDPAALRTRMLELANSHGLSQAGERPERGLFRLATELLPDPAVTPAVKAGIYQVLAGLDLDAVRARNLGIGQDARSRTGLVLELAFEEGVHERLVLDRDSGALLSDESVLPDGSFFGGQVYLAEELLASVPGAAA